MRRDFTPRRRRSEGAAAVLLLLLLAAALAGAAPEAAAQVPPGVPPERLGVPERFGLPDRERPELPPFEAPPPDLPAPPEALPPVPERPATGLAVVVREVRLVGNTVFSDADLDPLVRRYEGRAVTTEQLLRLRDELTAHYIERGYINSGAVIPDQDVVDGVITVEIVEGRLDEIEVTGLEWLRPGLVADRIRLGAGPPLHVIALQERLQLLLTDPAVAGLDARLGPGERRGGSRLEVEAREARRFTAALTLSNERSASVGEPYGELELGVRSLLGRSDPLVARLGLSEGLRLGQLGYVLPLGPGGPRLRLFGEVSDSEVVEEPFDELDIESETYTFEAGLRWTLVERLDREVTAGADLVRRRSETSLLGRPFSFSPGVRDGKSDVTAFRLPLEWLDRGGDQVLAFRSTFNVGVDLLGATSNPDADVPDSRFVSWLGQAQLARRFGFGGGDHQLLARADVQLTSDPLLPLEQLAIGGIDTVRGYRENVLVRDAGWIVSLEYRWPLFTLPVPALSRDPRDGVVFLAPFFDAGGGSNRRRETPDPEVIYSVGAGLLWSPAPNLGAEIYVGVPLEDVPDVEDEALQDLGIHFRIRAGLY